MHLILKTSNKEIQPWIMQFVSWEQNSWILFCHSLHEINSNCKYFYYVSWYINISIDPLYFQAVCGFINTK